MHSIRGQPRRTPLSIAGEGKKGGGRARGDAERRWRRRRGRGAETHHSCCLIWWCLQWERRGRAAVSDLSSPRAVCGCVFNHQIIVAIHWWRGPGITLPAASILAASFITQWIFASQGWSDRQRETVSDTLSGQQRVFFQCYYCLFKRNSVSEHKDCFVTKRLVWI